jgi:hypothetical protein
VIIAVDVGVGRVGAQLLRDCGHVVIEAEHCEMDRVWFHRARELGAELFVSPDSDIEILCYDHNIRFVKQLRCETGLQVAQRVLRPRRARRRR